MGKHNDVTVQGIATKTDEITNSEGQNPQAEMAYQISVSPQRHFFKHDYLALVWMYAFIIVTVVACYFMYTAYMQQGIRLRTANAVCNYAHNNNDGGSEEACGIAQDAADAEFLCRPDGLTDICWTEAK